MNRFRIGYPASGWFASCLAFFAILTPGIAAAQSPLAPPTTPIVMAGLVGLLIGFDRAAGIMRYASRSRASKIANVLTHNLVWITGALILVGVVGNVLPPIPLMLQDLEAIIARAQGVNTSDTHSLLFLSSSITRFLADVSRAPNAAQSGARLLLGLSGTLLTWVAAIILGHAVANPRQALISVLPLIAALALIAIPGGEGGFALGMGLLCSLLFAATAMATQRIQIWEKRQIDYSDEIHGDIRFWAGIIISIALAFAWIIPLWPGNPVSKLLASLGEGPSGVAALQLGVGTGGSGDDPTRVGLSTLPSLRLGNSIAQGPPGQVALQVILNIPLEKGTPTYWRMRVLEHYRSDDWSSEAIVTPQQADPIQPNFVGAVIQTVIDRRPDKQLLVGLPDIVAINIPTRLERLADGSLSAAAGNPPERQYQILSRPQALAPLPQRDQNLPDMAPYLALPESLPPRVAELAAAIVGRQREPRARALALEAYLRQLPYQYEVQRLPAEGDAVDQFLFEMRSGYCTYYASSMAIMARTLGIPARIAIGYAAGEQQSDGSYIVHEADAHAWPELYLNERWVIFEPTPIRALPDRGTPLPDIEAVDTESTASSLWLPSWEWLVGGALLLVLLVAGYFIWLNIPDQTTPDPLALAAADLERIGERIGVAWPRGATIREYSDSLIAQVRTQSEPIQQVTNLIERGRYTGKTLTSYELARLETMRFQLDKITKNPESK